MTYELETANQDILAQGVFYRYKKQEKFSGLVTKSGSLIPDASDKKAISTLYEDTDVLVFETDNHRYFCFPDHSRSVIGTLVNMPGVQYTQEVKLQNINASRAHPEYKHLSETSSDTEFYNCLNHIYLKVLKEVNHPAKEMTF